MPLVAENDLTPKQRIFVDEYVANGFNATQAASKAGYQGDVRQLSVIGAQNLAKLSIKSAINARTQPLVKKAEKRIVNTYEEFTKNLEFVGKLRDACKEWLTDPDSDKFTINPRGDEIDVVYFDYDDKDAQGNAKRKTASLQEILARLDGTRYAPDTQYVKTVDLREYALKTIDRIDMTLDKFAKMGGDYTKDKNNDADNLSIAKKVVAELLAQGTDKDEAVEFVVGRYGVLADKVID